ncbi:hypothetical protein B0J11DRAFT_536371, partial [Dendryphion nanum]
MYVCMCVCMYVTLSTLPPSLAFSASATWILPSRILRFIRFRSTQTQHPFFHGSSASPACRFRMWRCEKRRGGKVETWHQS